jgi:peptide/nickel transport system substrate-binding protein
VPLPDQSRRAFIGLLSAAAGSLVPGAEALAATKRTTTKKRTTTTRPPTTRPTATTVAGGSATAPQGTLRFGAGWPFTSWDPHDGLRSGTAPIIYWRPVFDTLFTRDEKFAIKPGLATKWTFTEKQLAMTLRTGVVFSDGTPFTAEACGANIRHMLLDPRAAGIKAKVADVRVEADRVVIATSEPIPDLVRQLASQRGMMVQPSQLTGNGQVQPIGTGPYLFDQRASIPGQKLVYTLNPKHWNAANQQAEKIEMTVLADPGARVNALLSGQVDVTYFDNALANQAIKAGIKSATTLGSQYALLIFDRGGRLVPALAKPEVRLAIGWAIDRTAFAATTLPGIGQPALQPFRKGEPGYDPQLENVFGFDRAYAKQLLTRAGYPDGFTMDIPSALPFQQPIEVLAANLKEIGINLRIQSLDISQYGPRGTSGQFPALFVPVLGSAAYDLAFAMVDQRGGLNPNRISDAKLNELFTSLERAFDDEKDRYLGVRLLAAMMESGVFIPLANADKHAFYREGVTGVAWNVDEPGVNPIGIRPPK